MEEIEITLKNLATLHSDAYHKHEDTSGFTFFHTTTLSVLRRLPEGVQFHIKLAYTKVKIDDEHDIKLIIGYLSIERMLFVAYAFSVYLTPSNLLPLLDPLMAYNTSLRSLELRTLEDEDVHRETAKKMFPSPTIYRQKIIHTSLVQEHLRWIKWGLFCIHNSVTLKTGF
ncbi:hypothetical protein CI109_100102 [Kwoniella shandongensis]|uniref:Uncharacterized protein n=1 Tax=Kwoniella shandongensis TaxID=1734106 RepID=A0AAJ8MS94_9TREE